MSKAFVVLNSTHTPTHVFLIPEGHTTSHHLGQLRKAAEDRGRYGLLLDIQECGALEAADILKQLEPERDYR